MDKKNTMLLTVIAVATLLVAVVGATFAYFTASTATKGQSTAVSTQVTGNPGTFTATTNTTAMWVRLTHEEMAQAKVGNYYAQAGTATTDSVSTTDAVTETLATIQSTGGSTTAEYACTYTFTVGTTATADKIKAGDGTIVLSSTDFTLGDDEKTIDLASLIGAAKTITAEANFGYEQTKTISIQAYITNKDDAVAGDGSGVQDYMADLDAQINIEPVSLECPQTK